MVKFVDGEWHGRRLLQDLRRKIPPVHPPLALSDRQLGVVVAAAQSLAPEKRVVLLERLEARLRDGRPRPSDADVQHALEQALRGLVHGQAPAA